MQEAVEAPFVLENLDCSGSEARLVDCAEAVEEYESTYPLEIDFDYYERRSKRCDLEFAPYAYVACGTLTEPGAKIFK